jgi:hypothetical protein
MVAQQEFESQKKGEEISEAELEEQAVLKLRAEGTPCTKENFLEWKRKFDEEMAQKALEAAEITERELTGRKKEKKEDKSGRLTGFAQFSGAAMNLEAIEAAAQEAENEEIDPDELNVDEELFDVDDEDLDELDFDSDDYEDEEEPEPDI